MSIYSKKYPQGYYVYAYIRNKSTSNGPAGSPYYIGKGCGRRAWVPHCTPRDHSYILILEENLTELGAFAIERRLIKWYGRLNLGTGILRNRTDGGDGTPGRKLSDAERCERRNRKHSLKTRKKIGEKNRGRLHNTETKRKLSIIAKTRTFDHFKGGFKGRTHSVEIRERLRKLNSEQQWYNNGYTEKMSRIPLGTDWKPGRPPNKMSWWNNSEIVKRSKESPGPEWIRGRLHGTKGTSGMRYYNNGSAQKLFLTDPGLPWSIGKLPISINDQL